MRVWSLYAAVLLLGVFDRAESSELPGGYNVGDRVQSLINFDHESNGLVIGDVGTVSGPVNGQPTQILVVFDSGSRVEMNTSQIGTLGSIAELPGGYHVGDRVQSLIKFKHVSHGLVIGDIGTVSGPGGQPNEVLVVFDRGSRVNMELSKIRSCDLRSVFGVRCAPANKIGDACTANQDPGNKALCCADGKFEKGDRAGGYGCKGEPGDACTANQDPGDKALCCADGKFESGDQAADNYGCKGPTACEDITKKTKCAVAGCTWTEGKVCVTEEAARLDEERKATEAKAEAAEEERKAAAKAKAAAEEAAREEDTPSEPEECKESKYFGDKKVAKTCKSLKKKTKKAKKALKKGDKSIKKAKKKGRPIPDVDLDKLNAAVSTAQEAEKDCNWYAETCV